MTRHWSLTEARQSLSQIVAQAQHAGPQIITRRGQPVAVVLSHDEYTRLQLPAHDLVAFFRASPLMGEDLDLARSPEPARMPPDV